MTGIAIAVNINPNHSFSKSNQDSIKLITGIGIEGDVHAGKTVKRGIVRTGDTIKTELPPPPYRSLAKV